MNDTVEKWYAHLDYCKQQRKLNLPLTKEEEEYEDFIEQKLDDYRTDYYGQAGL